MLFLHPYKTIFFLFLSNIDNGSKILAFQKFKRLLYKYYPKFVKAYKKQSNRLDIRQFLVFFYMIAFQI